MFVDFEPFIGLGIHMLAIVCTKMYLTMKDYNAQIITSCKSAYFPNFTL